ncbi:ribonuclease inhibitor [Streptomyces sp. TRM66268-LWL]|uniref:Ribonuclease inhibitor n=1 Tax=Streptomyces polyasparticus TaxID=2767826 RepID=A0ABR7SDM4_9ACTN|nr:ribonuclease inhibitor [Streptomyces polyasparticus]
MPSVVPRPLADLTPLLDWLRGGRPAGERLDFTAGTALPDGRLDLCKQALGPEGAALVADALRESARDRRTAPGTSRDGQVPQRPDRTSDGDHGAPVRHVLLGTDGLGDEGAAAATRAAEQGQVETLYLGCNGITAPGACRIADQLRASPTVVAGIWLKRNPLGPAGGRAAAELIEAIRTLRTLDLVQTGLDPAGLALLVDALVAADGQGRTVERLFVGGNPLGAAGGRALGALVSAGAVGELYVSAARLGDEGARHLAVALGRAPYGRLTRLSVASNGIGPRAAALLVSAAAASGVEVLDLGRVRAARTLGARDNQLDLAAAREVAHALAGQEHRLAHLVLSHTGMRSREAHQLLDTAPAAVSATRFVLGSSIAASVKRRLNELSAHVPPPRVPEAVAAVRSVHRTAPPTELS